jgi:dihydrofolate reductase
MVIMGSGTIVSQFSAARLIDEYQIVVNPSCSAAAGRCSPAWMGGCPWS